MAVFCCLGPITPECVTPGENLYCTLELLLPDREHRDLYYAASVDGSKLLMIARISPPDPLSRDLAQPPD
jgi:hypothetical protein